MNFCSSRDISKCKRVRSIDFCLPGIGVLILFASLESCSTCSAEILEDFAGGIGAACAGDTVAGVRAVAAEVEALHWHTVTRPAKQRTHGKNLVECEFAVEWVPAGETICFFEVFRREDLPGQNFPGQVGRVDCERLDDCVGQRVTLL